MDSNKFMENLQKEISALEEEHGKLSSAQEFFETNEGRSVIKLLAKSVELNDNGFKMTNRAIRTLVSNPVYRRNLYMDMKELGFSYEHLPAVMDDAPSVIFRLRKSN